MTKSQAFADRIAQHFAAGGSILIATYTKATLYKPKHAAMFKASTNPEREGVLVQRGRSWDYVFPQYVQFVGRSVEAR